MLRERIELQYRLTFSSVFHFGTGMRAGLTHRAVARDAAGYLYVPGSTLKGVVRDHATRIAALLGIFSRPPHNLTDDLAECAPQADITTLIFGSRWRPCTLAFDDARLCRADRDFFGAGERQIFKERQIETRTRVSMSRLTGTARAELLFSSEAGIPDLSFDGQITGVLDGVPTSWIDGTPDATLDAADHSYSVVLLLAALRSIDRLGAGKSSGGGRLHCSITQLVVDGTERSVDSYLERIPTIEFYTLAEEEDRKSDAAANSSDR